MRQALPAILFAMLTAGSASAETGFVPIEIRTMPITEFRIGSSETHFGDLEFLGGFAAVSKNGDFGSWSGLDFAADGTTLVAVADTGFWLTAKLHENNGRPVDLAGAKIGAMLVDNGLPAPKKVGADAEGLRLVIRDGKETALVSFEQTTAVRSYSGPDFAAAVPKPVALPKFVKDIRRNQGLEAIATAPAGGALGGSIVVIAEHSLDAAKNHRGFVLSGPKAGAFAIRRSDEFDITDAAFLPEGDLLILERRFSFSAGFAMRMRRIAGGSIRPGATLDGSVVVEAGEGYQIDNMEGLAVRTNDSGQTIVTLISDDNHGLLQRTILLQFALQPALPPLPHPRP